MRDIIKTFRKRKGQIQYVIIIEKITNKLVTKAKLIKNKYSLHTYIWEDILLPNITSKAVCNPSDTYDEDFGIALAEYRLFKALYTIANTKLQGHVSANLNNLFGDFDPHKKIRAD